MPHKIILTCSKDPQNLNAKLAIDDTHVEATALMGFVYRSGGIFPKAMQYAKKASKLDKNNEMVRELIKELS